MISTNFYPDNTTIGGDMVITQSLPNLNLTDKTVDPMAAYYMGKIQSLQNFMYVGTYVHDTDAGIYKLEKDPSVQPDWGYGYTSGGSGYNQQWPYWNGSKWAVYSNNLCFINSMKYYKATMAAISYTITCKLYDFSNDQTLGTGEHIRYTKTEKTGYFQASTNGFYKVLSGTDFWNVTIDGVTYQLGLSNWSSSGKYFDVGDNKRIYITQATRTSGNNYNCIYYNGNQFNLDIIYSIKTEGTPITWWGSRLFRAFSDLYAMSTDIRVERDELRTAMSYDNSVSSGTSQIYGIKPFEVSAALVNYAMSTSPTYHQDEYVINSNDDLVKSTGANLQVNYFCDLMGWLKYCIDLGPKWATAEKADGTAMTVNNNSPEYLPNTAVPLFDTSNNPVGTPLKADAYRDLEPRLRPWQKYGYDINDDDFDPDSEDPSGGGDPTDDTDIPTKDDGKDDGTPPGVDGYSSNYSMTKFVTMNSTAWNDLKTNLSQAVAASAADPTNTSLLAYKLGGWKSDGTFEAANELSIMKFIASARFYPFDITQLVLQDNSSLVDTQNVKTALTFGYRGASVACSNMDLNYNIAMLKTMTIKVPSFKGGAQDNTSDVTFEEFEPFTKYTLMLPFIGEMNIPAHNAVRATIGITYFIDFNSGTCAALVQAAGGFNKSTAVIGCMSGTCSTGVSIAGNDAVTQGDKMAAATLNKQSTELALSRAKFDFAYGVANSVIKAGEAEVNSQAKGFATGIGAVQSLAQSSPDIVHGAMDIESAKIGDKLADINCTQAQRSVPTLLNFGSNATGNICINQPCLKIERTLVVRGNGYKHAYGWPTYQQRKLGTIDGYFECANPDVSGLTSDYGAIPTEIEMKMVNDALRSGSIMSK